MSTNPQRREWFFPIEEAPVLVAVTHKGVARDVRVPHKKALIAADTGDMVHAFPTTKGEWTEVKAPFKLFTGSWRGTELPDKTFDPAKIRRLDLQLSVPAVPSGRAMPVETLPYPIPREAPWMAGLRAARANFVPGLIVQAVMLGLLLAYWLYPPTTLLLNRLALIKAHWGYGYSAASAIIAGALIPELLRIAVFQKGRICRNNAGNLLFTVPFWCAMGIVVDALYRAQAVWFGADAAFPVVAKKVLVDQFIYNPLFAAPCTAMLYDWKNRGYGFHRLGDFFTTRYYRSVVVPTLFATWGVWIPIVTILYSLPSLLQIPLFGLALSLWVMLYTWMSERRADPE